MRTMSAAPDGLRACTPRRWWSTSTLVVHCTDYEDFRDGQLSHRVFRWDTRQSRIGREITSTAGSSSRSNFVVNAWYRGRPNFHGVEDAYDGGIGLLYSPALRQVGWAGAGFRPVTIIGSRAYGMSVEGWTVHEAGYVIRKISDRRTITVFPRSIAQRVTSAVVIDPSD